MLKLWKAIRQRLGLTGYFSYTPIWNNRLYMELTKLGTFTTWMQAGIKYISQLYADAGVNPFPRLLSECPLRRHSHYQYTQLCHALNRQSRQTPMHLTESTFLESIFTEKDKKGIISKIYVTLLSYLQAPGLLPCRERWERVVGPISGEQWEQILVSGPLVSVFAAHKLCHLFS